MRGLTLAGPRCTVPPRGQNHLSAVEYRGWCGRDYRREKRGEREGEQTRIRFQVAAHYLRRMVKTGLIIFTQMQFLLPQTLYDYLVGDTTNPWKSVLFGIESHDLLISWTVLFYFSKSKLSISVLYLFQVIMLARCWQRDIGSLILKGQQHIIWG